MDSEDQKTNQAPKSRSWIWILVLLVFIVVIGAGFLYYRKRQMNMGGGVGGTNMAPMPGINNRLVSAAPAPQNMSRVTV